MDGSGEPILFAELLDALDDVGICHALGLQPIDQAAEFRGCHLVHALSLLPKIFALPSLEDTLIVHHKVSLVKHFFTLFNVVRKKSLTSDTR